MENNIYFIDDVEKIINRNRLTLRRWWKKGIFPHPILLESNRLAWKASTIKEWIDDKFEGQKRSLFQEIKEGINEINESEYVPFKKEDYK